MGAPEVEDAAGGGEGVVLKIQAWRLQGCCPDFRTLTHPADQRSLVKERFFRGDQGHDKTFFRPVAVSRRRLLFVPQSLDRIQTGGPEGWNHAADQSPAAENERGRDQRSR